jgi:heme-degrading monooxygenase HmoA
MFVVIFEVHPRQGHWDDYLELAKFLKPKLEEIDGFIENERFRSKRTEGRLLSLSTWRDEKAVIRWRTVGAHHHAQEKGRGGIFGDYHLRVGEITADSQTPAAQSLHQQRFDATEVGVSAVVTISELAPVSDEPPAGAGISAALDLPMPGISGIIDHEIFESIYNPGKLLLLVSWRDALAAQQWQPNPIVGQELRHRQVRVIRDYGMFDRREAPQYYPEISREVEEP